MGIEILADRCVGCGACVDACPFGAISMEGGKAVIGPGCTLCGACVDHCGFDAILFETPGSARKEAGSGVWVYCEVRGKRLMRSALELLTKGKELAEQLNQELCAVLIGREVEPHLEELGRYGAGRVYKASSPELDEYLTETYAPIVSELVRVKRPGIVLFPASNVGRDLAPRVAASLGVGLTADCTGLSVRDGQLVQSRPAFGGNIMADIISPDVRPQMATVRPNVFKAKENDSGGFEVEDVPVTISKKAASVKILEIIRTSSEHRKSIEDADIVISGGSAMGSAEAFSILEEFADVVGGAVGASRAAVDSGWRPRSDQVGQTGKTVSPRLYIACGISGKIQHQVGMKGSEFIVAINKDPEAPIFRIADYGIVGDLFEVVPAMTEKIRKTLKN